MTVRSKYLAATAALAFAAFASINAASAQAVTDPTLVQPTAVAPVAAPATTAYPATSAYPAAAQPQPYTAGPPPMMGAVAGTTAADRDGDGIVDGYYTSDGFYHPYVSPTPAPAPQYLSRRGERG